MPRSLILCPCGTGNHCGNYARDAEHGYHWKCQSMPRLNSACCWEVIPGSDGGSFEALNMRYARDKTGAYFGEDRIVGSDAAAFRVLNNPYSPDDPYAHYAKDSTGGYHFGDRIEGSDSASFEALNCIYAQDQFAAYCRGERIESANRAHFKVLGDGYYALDDRLVYIWSGNSLKLEQLAEADPKTFKALEGSGYGVDQNHVYYGERVVIGADSCSIELLIPPERNPWNRADYARDHARVYYWGKVVPTAEPLSFHLLGSKYAVDRSRVFFQGLPLKGADGVSFCIVNNKKIDESFYPDAEDADSWYCVTADGVNRRSKK